MELINTTHFRIVGIDPGTNTLGVALLSYDLVNQSLLVDEALTFTADTMIHRYPNIIDAQGERYARIHAHRENLKQYFQTHQPHAIASEAPYFRRLVQAFASLTECVYAIRMAAYDYDQFRPLHTIDPATVKKSVGVSGKSGDKEEMRKAILRLGILTTAQEETLHLLDEHAIDAIAVAYTHFRTLT